MLYEVITAVAQLAGDVEPAAVEPQDHLHDGEAQPHARPRPAALVHPVEALGHPRKVVGCDAAARVAHLHGHVVVGVLDHGRDP